MVRSEIRQSDFGLKPAREKTTLGFDVTPVGKEGAIFGLKIEPTDQIILENYIVLLGLQFNLNFCSNGWTLFALVARLVWWRDWDNIPNDKKTGFYEIAFCEVPCRPCGFTKQTMCILCKWILFMTRSWASVYLCRCFCSRVPPDHWWRASIV